MDWRTAPWLAIFVLSWCTVLAIDDLHSAYERTPGKIHLTGIRRISRPVIRGAPTAVRPHPHQLPLQHTGTEQLEHINQEPHLEHHVELEHHERPKVRQTADVRIGAPMAAIPPNVPSFPVVKDEEDGANHFSESLEERE
uniref:Secreted protein n=2 Tax=Bursaphelenchus xylophilus TaxID=6326 RepID=A0A1I7SJ14_BURXY